MLQHHGVEVAFGMGGFQPLPYYDALAQQDQIRHILIRDEKHGAFAADAYARVKNRPAVADATLGPGATNLISGAAESFGASIPLILLTGEVNGGIRGRAATQESDQVSMLHATVKASITLDRIERIPELVRRAFTIATAGRPGPVHLNIPEEVFHGRHSFHDSEWYASPGSCALGGNRTRPDCGAVARAAELLRTAKRPVVLVGGGVHLARAYDELARFLSVTQIPLAYSISGKGSVTDENPLCMGLCGRYSRYANDFIKLADVILVVGCKLGEISTNRWTIIPATARVIQIDIDPTEFGKVYRTEVGIWSDAALGLSELADALAGAKMSSNQRNELDAARAAWAAVAGLNYRSEERPLHMARVLHEIRRASPDEAIIVADGGFAAHWSALLYDIRSAGRTYIANRGHAAIGYGLPGAIGAKLAAPDRPVIALCGDNGFAMAVAELETAKRVGAPVVAVVVNNAALGYVKALQHGLYEDRFISVDFLDVDYGLVARAFGCEGVRVKSPDELHDALEAGVRSKVPFVIDVGITTDPARMLPGVDRRAARAMAAAD